MGTMARRAERGWVGAPPRHFGEAASLSSADIGFLRAPDVVARYRSTSIRMAAIEETQKPYYPTVSGYAFYTWVSRISFLYAIDLPNALNRYGRDIADAASSPDRPRPPANSVRMAPERGAGGCGGGVAFAIVHL